MKFIKNISENKNILLGLVIALLAISIIQSVFLFKLYRSDKQDFSPDQFSRDLGQHFNLKDDFLKRFDESEWDPFKELQAMREPMDRMFDDSYNRFRLNPFFDEDKKKDTLLQQTDLLEKDDRYIVRMNIPGSDKAEINVDVTDGTLNVRANIQTNRGDENGNSWHRLERSMGSFERSLTLPGPVDAGAVKTEYEDGVLTIILPKQK